MRKTCFPLFSLYGSITSLVFFHQLSKAKFLLLQHLSNQYITEVCYQQVIAECEIIHNSNRYTSPCFRTGVACFCRHCAECEFTSYQQSASTELALTQNCLNNEGISEAYKVNMLADCQRDVIIIIAMCLLFCPNPFEHFSQSEPFCGCRKLCGGSSLE